VSRYEKLCDLYRNSRQKLQVYQEESVVFAERLVKGLVEDFSVPPGETKCFPPGQPERADGTLPLKQTLMMGQDLYWHFGLEIMLLSENPETEPGQPVQIHLSFKKVDGNFQLKVAGKEHTYEVNLEKGQPFKPFFDDLFATIQESLKEGVDRFTEKKPPACKIGFMSECP